MHRDDLWNFKLVRSDGYFTSRKHLGTFVLCIGFLEYWNQTLTVDDDVKQEHEDARLVKNVYGETAIWLVFGLFSVKVDVRFLID